MKFVILMAFLTHPLHAAQKTYRIMPVGDSITERGGAGNADWRYNLWEKLYIAGYLFEYVGSRKTDSPIGELPHEGYGGKNSAFLSDTVPANFRKHPADIVLLHAGHNQFADQKPVPGIIRDTGALITSFRKVNPKAIILLAQPVPSSKLPKYSYIPELHLELSKLAIRLNQPASPVIIVPQGEGYDPIKDNIADGVHPGPGGAGKIAARWFEALVKVMDKPPAAYQPEIVIYKKTPQAELTLHLFKPAASVPAAPRPAIVFFHGGGWNHGSPHQFYPECKFFAEKGCVAISVEYRIKSMHGTTAFEAVADGKSAIRWVRQHAAKLGVDPRRVAAAGASAGGQVAAACGTLQNLDDPTEPVSVSSRPDALALWYPVIDNGPGGFGDAAVKARYKEISPLHNISANTPPTIIFLGTKDPLVPVATARKFQKEMEKAGVHCELKTYDGAGHPIYRYQTRPSPLRDEILNECLDFLADPKRSKLGSPAP